VRIGGVQRDVPDQIGGLSGQLVVGQVAAGGEAVPGRRTGRDEVFLDELAPGQQPSFVVGYRVHRLGTEEQGRAVADADVVEVVRQRIGVDHLRRAGRPAVEVEEDGVAREIALPQAVVVTVGGIPRHAQPGRRVRPPGRLEEARHLGKTGPVERGDRVGRLRVPVVQRRLDAREELRLAGRDALVEADLARVRHDVAAAVEEFDVPTGLVVLAVVHRVAGHDGERQRQAEPRPVPDVADRPAHRVGEVRRQRLLRPVRRTGRVRPVVRRTRIGVAVHELDPAR
jgi:hypothetical protein